MSLYIDSFDVHSVAISKSGGAIKRTWSELAAGQLGKFTFLSGSRQIINEKQELIANYILNTAYASMVKGYKVIFGSKAMYVTAIDETTLKGSNPHYEIYLLWNDDN